MYYSDRHRQRVAHQQTQLFAKSLVQAIVFGGLIATLWLAVGIKDMRDNHIYQTEYNPAASLAPNPSCYLHSDITNRVQYICSHD